MNFLLVLFAVAVEFTLSSAAGWRSSAWSTDWAAWCEQRGAGRRWWRQAGAGWLALALIVLPPALAVAGLAVLIAYLSPFLGHVAALLILLLMLGPEDLVGQVMAYRRVGQYPFAGDEAMPTFARDADTLGFPAYADGATFDRDQRELAALALAAERAWFAPLFWFFVGGPLAVVLYRHTASLRRVAVTPTGPLAQLSEALEFVPARVTAFALGLVGTLVPVFEAVRRCGVTRLGVSAELVARAALAAADDGRIYEVTANDGQVYRLNMMLALLKRAVIVWLVVFGGLNLLGF